MFLLSFYYLVLLFFYIFLFFFFFFCFVFFFYFLLFFFFFFFFQAEDGIRDGRVTGVQTCALPISCRSRAKRFRSSTTASRAFSSRAASRSRLRAISWLTPHIANAAVHTANRSEERRVGKECRSRWSPDR